MSKTSVLKMLGANHISGIQLATFYVAIVFAWLHPPTQFVGVSDYYFTIDDVSKTKARIRTHATSNGYRFKLTSEFEVCCTPMFCVGKHTVLHTVFSHL